MADLRRRVLEAQLDARNLIERLLKHAFNPEGFHPVEHSAAVKLLLRSESRAWSNGRLNCIIRLVCDRDARSTQIQLEVLNRRLGVFNLKAYVRRRIVAKPHLLLKQHI